MRLDSYERFTEFQRMFHQYCIECDTEQLEFPMYQGYVDLCKEIAKRSHEAGTYQYNMIAWKSACRHWPRARWVANRLFTDYRHVLVGDVDLVLWGCGAGLEMLALYDQALQCDVPQFWMVIQSITLIDDNGRYAARAKEIAEVLFPMAKGRIRSVTCDFNNEMEVAFLADVLQMQASDGYTPRLHYLTHSICSSENADVLSRALKNAVRRYNARGEAFFNEIFVASIPCGNRTSFCHKMRTFESEWKAEIGFGSLDEANRSPMGVYYAFHCITYDNPLRVALRSENPIFRELLRICRGENDMREWFRMMSVLARLTVDGRVFSDVYGYVKELRLSAGSRRDGDLVQCLYFAPFPRVDARGLIVKFGKCDDQNRYEKLNLAKSWLRKFAKKSKIESIVELSERLRYIQRGQSVRCEYGKLMRIVKLQSWDCRRHRLVDFPGDIEGHTAVRVEPCDHSSFFGVYEDEVTGEVLPNTLNADQRGIIYSRRRQRLIRGGPGTGKTLTMLHHALVVHEHTHLPVLLVTKTNSLTGNNMRRLEGSYFSRFPKTKCLKEDTFCVVTINTLLCELARGIRTGAGEMSCLRDKCKRCLAACDGTEIRGPIVPQCDTDVCCSPDSAQYAVGIMTQYPDGSPVDRLREKMKVLSAACDRCNEETRNEVLSGDVRIPETDAFLMRGIHLFRTWGGVLVDEAQLINPEELKVVWRLTEHFNPLREFYMFADEEQSLHSEALVKDTNGKMSVVVPGKNFGRWKTLKGNHRVKSRALLGIYRRLQVMMGDKYDLNELMMDLPNGEADVGRQMNLGRVFRVIRLDLCPAFSLLYDIIADYSRWARSKTVVIIIDDENTVREFHDSAYEHGWLLTHLPAVRDDHDRKTERAMRLKFQEEEGHIHLTTIDCAQGRTFENVVFIVTRDANPDCMEEAFTGFTRASKHLQVVDVSSSGWVAEMLGEGVEEQQVQTPLTQ